MQSIKQKINFGQSNRHTMQDDSLFTLLDFVRDSLLTGIVEKLNGLNARMGDEFYVTVSEKQINDALAQFVTRNVKAILNMRIELKDGWFRLYCTIHSNGIYTEIASNFDLVHIQLDRHRQRLVFAQQGNTEILDLYANQYWQKLAIQKGLSLYRKITKSDPLGMILKKVQLARIKENVVYIDIGRWLRNDDSIMTTLYKGQINYAKVAPEQLVLQASINFRDLFATNASGDIISEADNINEYNPTHNNHKNKK